MAISQSVAIIGAGNLGRWLAVHLVQAGHQVHFCVRRQPGPVHVAGFKAMWIPAYLVAPPPADITLLTVKAYDTAAALRWLAPATTVAVIQNGVHHARRVAPHPAIPVLSYVYVESRDGVYHPFAPPRAHFTVPATPAARGFVSLFAGTPIVIDEEPDFHTAAWRKMLHNCVSNPLTAIAGRGLEILAEPLYRDWAQRILAEALPIAQADGALLTEGDAAAILETLASYPPGTRTSMLQDRELGKRLEMDVLNGTLVALGKRYQIATPVNQDICDRLQ